MIPWLKTLLYDAESFGNVARALVFVGGEVLQQVPSGEAGWWAGKILQSLALLMRSGGASTAKPTQ